MLLLIGANGHKIGLIKQDIRRHQHRIGEQAAVDVVGVLARFVLKLRHARKLAHVGIAVENPGKLRVLMDVGLEKDDVLFRIQSAGEENGQRAQAGLAQLRGILANGDGVQIDDGIKTVVFVLKHLKIAQRADIIAQREVAGGLYAGEDAFFCFHRDPPDRGKLFNYAIS